MGIQCLCMISHIFVFLFYEFLYFQNDLCVLCEVCLRFLRLYSNLQNPCKMNCWGTGWPTRWSGQMLPYLSLSCLMTVLRPLTNKSLALQSSWYWECGPWAWAGALKLRKEYQHTTHEVRNPEQPLHASTRVTGSPSDSIPIHSPRIN